MRTWFIRCNGNTAHNQPGIPRYKEDEPPQFPCRKFNYSKECLLKGFARIGLPATGDLRDLDWQSRGLEVYGSEWLNSRKIREHEEFLSIEVGDIIVMPTYKRRYEVYLGVTILPRRRSQFLAPGQAYYYFYEILDGDWYENAHRVDIEWANTNGVFRKFDIPELGGTWRRAFSPVIAASQKIEQLTRGTGLLQ